MGTALTLIVLFVALALCWRYLGAYMLAIYEGRVRWLRGPERLIYRALGVDSEAEQSWERYTMSLIIFSAVAILVTYALIRLQGHLPLNPEHLPGVSPALSFNTAVSFVTNTNWQNYSGETTMSYLSQMGSLTVQMFVSASVGIAVAVALIRGFARKESSTIGNFWVDLVRGVLYLLLPISFVMTFVFVGQGAIQTFAGPAHIKNALDGFTQVIARGPVASMEVIKELGTNGGGFFNANGADPFENPTGLTNLLSVILILSIPFSLTYVFGKMVGNIRQGVAVVATMLLFFCIWTAVGIGAEHGANTAVHLGGIAHQVAGNMNGKETRFGSSSSALYNIASTQTSTGSVDASNDSFTPIGGMMVLTGMMLGEVTPGGVGSGLYTILLFAIVAVFLGGLMVGRTPEHLGKKIQAREVKIAALGVLVMPITVLVLTGIATAVHSGTSATLNSGPHGFTEILYAFTSQANNNGSAFAGLSGNTPFYNILGAVAMLVGRFGVIVPALALAGTLGKKGLVPESLGTFRTDTPLFIGLLVGVIVIVGGLTFFPAISLGPLAEQLSHGRLF
ncbi:MAG: potassium-transporting ATPase subunit KdpA [Acidimicrobiales bacterium]